MTSQNIYIVWGPNNLITDICIFNEKTRIPAQIAPLPIPV